MPRPPRFWFPGAVYHLICRGNNRQPTFFDQADHQVYLRLLGEARRRYDCRLFAYALMTNHLHLMVQTSQTHSVSTMMHFISTAYTMHVNQKYKRIGHVFHGRYRSILVEKDSYALELTRYIHLNPVRAGIVRAPEAYRWSSYRAYLQRQADPLTDAEEILKMLSPYGDDAERRAHYVQFVQDGLTAGRPVFQPEPLAVQGILGSPEFVLGVLGARSYAQARPDPF